MPVVNYQQYCKVLDSAKAGNYALPAINVSSALTANAANAGFCRSQERRIYSTLHWGWGICLRFWG